MSSRPKGGRSPTSGSSLSAEDRAFLDFVARLAVEEALREAKANAAAVPCGGEPTGEKSGDDGNA
jgi:hypothetical protein